MLLTSLFAISGALLLLATIMSKKKTSSLILGCLACIFLGAAVIVNFSHTTHSTLSSVLPKEDYIVRMDTSEKALTSMILNPESHTIVEGNAGNGKSYMVSQLAHEHRAQFSDILSIDFAKTPNLDDFKSLLSGTIENQIRSHYKKSKHFREKPLLLIFDHLEKATAQSMDILTQLLQNIPANEVKFVCLTNNSQIADHISIIVKNVHSVHIEEPSKEHVEEYLENKHNIKNPTLVHELLGFNYDLIDRKLAGEDLERKYVAILKKLERSSSEGDYQKLTKLIGTMVGNGGSVFYHQHRDQFPYEIVQNLIAAGLVRHDGSRLTFSSTPIRKYFEDHLEVYENPQEALVTAMRKLGYRDQKRFGHMVEELLSTSPNGVKSDEDVRKLFSNPKNERIIMESRLFKVIPGKDPEEFYVQFKNSDFGDILKPVDTSVLSKVFL